MKQFIEYGVLTVNNSNGDVMNQPSACQITHDVNCIRVRLTSGNLTICKNAHTGRIVCSMKDGVIQHEGIFLGIDPKGTCWVLHTSNRQGGPVFSSMHVFGNGSPVQFVERQCTFHPNEVIDRGIAAFWKNEPYNIWSANCQHLVSSACLGEKKSWQLDTFAEIVLATFVGGIFVAVVTSDD